MDPTYDKSSVEFGLLIGIGYKNSINIIVDEF
jgi:hypothetical protein